MKQFILWVTIITTALFAASCGKKEAIDVSPGTPLVYLKVSGAVVSSFDNTPDWAPLPDPMAPVDGDILTRWSPKLGLDNEWIYFDFGKEKILSKIIIKWERAYAVKYEILASRDSKKWERLALRSDGKGAVEEIIFPAVRARYVKIIGLERINPQWGFSFWEFELYGPQSHNPDEKVIDKGKDLREEEKRKLEKELKKAESPLEPMTIDEFQKGICYTSWMYDELGSIASDKMLLHLKNLGVNFVAIVIPTYQDEIDSDIIFTNDFEGGDTPSDASIEHAVKVCHRLGMKVMIKPHVDPRDDTPRVDIVASREWFDSYERMILRYARLAEKVKVEMFSVGTELEGTTFSRWETRWRNVISKVKSVYSGYLVYSANWTEYAETPFWDMMDFVGIDAYFPIASELDPGMDELVNSWEKLADDLEGWLKEKGLDKKIIFTEIGYPSSDGAAKQPWVQITEVEDQNEQRDCLDAVFSVMTKRAYFKGAYLWQYLPQNRWSPLGFTVKDKKAEKVLSDWYKKAE